jgi:hypothetical protein
VQLQKNSGLAVGRDQSDRSAKALAQEMVKVSEMMKMAVVDEIQATLQPGTLRRFPSITQPNGRRR